MEEDEQFRMACPKCGSYNFTVRRDQRAYVHKSQPFELVFSCRCGKQLFGDQIQEEYDRQKGEHDQGNGPVIEETTDPALEERNAEEERRKEQLRRAMEYRRKFLAEKRRAQLDQERERKEDEDRRWREKVALVEAEGVLRPTKPKRSTRLSSMTALPAAPGSPPVAAPNEPAPAPRPAPTRASAPAATAPTASTPAPAEPVVRSSAPPSDDVLTEVDPNHPHAEFMHYLLEGSFHEHFPDSESPDRKSPDLCVWPPCMKARRKKSKYCSRECSNKNARWRHKMRKKD